GAPFLLLLVLQLPESVRLALPHRTYSQEGRCGAGRDDQARGLEVGPRRQSSESARGLRSVMTSGPFCRPTTSIDGGGWCGTRPPDGLLVRGFREASWSAPQAERRGAFDDSGMDRGAGSRTQRGGATAG